MRGFDFAPLYRSTIGFDRLVDLLDAANRFDNALSYPPYNIERTGEDTYRITMAVAGFSEDDLTIEQREQTLVVAGQQQAEEREEQRNYLHQGIAARAFERRFQLADHVKVTGASLENGLLNVELRREIPEEMKPRRIEIASGGGRKTKVIENRAA
jgi:molecular chaperone IbpA